MSDHEKASLIDRLTKGLEESIAYSKGQLSLVTTELPAPPPKTKPKQIVELRKAFRMSQAMFAATMNVSPKTVQSWEQGIREPSDAALRMLQVIREEPAVIKKIFATKASRSRKTAKRSARRPDKLTA